MSVGNPRDDRWAEWYTFHPNVVAVYNEVAGGSPPHEPLCPNDTSMPTKAEESLFPDEPLPVADPSTHCWCNAFCSYCHHHTDHHTYLLSRRQPSRGQVDRCKLCPDGICPR